MRHVLFRLDRDRYALPLASVREVVPAPDRFTTVPRAPAALKGVINLRGRVVPVVDLRALLSQQGPSAALAPSAKVLLLDRGRRELGFIVTEVDGIETIDKVRDRLNPAIELDGVLATMYDPRTLHSREVLERVVEAFGDDVLETVIGRTVKFPDASVSGMPITEFAPEHAAAQAYMRLARELVARGAVA